MLPFQERRRRKGPKIEWVHLNMLCFKIFEIDKVCLGFVRLSAGVIIGHKKGCEAVSADIRAHSGKGALPRCGTGDRGSHQC